MRRDADGVNRLVAYISPPTVNVTELEDQLRDHLPSFLVPYLFQLLPRLPVTSYGEVSLPSTHLALHPVIIIHLTGHLSRKFFSMLPLALVWRESML